MQITGMLDSPFVRRVVITSLHWGLPFEHRPISLFRHIPAFSAINPLLKAPTLTTDDGVVLMESSVILGALAAVHPELPSLWPADPAKRLAAASLSGIALTVGEKAVQLFYEGALRPPENQYEPWRERVFDFGVCATISGDGRVTAHPPHALLVDPRGGFLGIDLAEPPLTTAERDRVDAAVHAAGAVIAAVGYAGPFAIDGFVYGARELQTVCEINARHTFGWIARALGVRRLGFGPPPADGTVLIAPCDADPSCAWVRLA